MKNLPKLFLFQRRDRGSVLVICIWVLVFFSILCSGLYAIVSSQIRLVKRAEDDIICEYLAKAAVIYAQKNIINNQAKYDTLYELRGKKELELGLGTASYTIVDEESKININLASVEEVARLPGLDMDRAMDLSASTLKPLRAKEELLLLEGMTREIFDKLKDFITVFSDGKVNINTAPPEVLTALDLDEDTIAAIMDYKKGEDAVEMTADDPAFEKTGDIINKLREFKGLSGKQEADLLTLVTSGVLTVESSNFSINIETKVLGRAAKKYEIVFDKDKRKQWQEW